MKRDGRFDFDTELWVNWAKLEHHKLGNFQKAQQILRRAMEARPYDVRPYQVAGDLLSHGLDFGGARKVYFEGLTKADPTRGATEPENYYLRFKKRQMEAKAETEAADGGNDATAAGAAHGRRWRGGGAAEACPCGARTRPGSRRCAPAAAARR